MESLFLQILNMSITASYVILVVMAVRLFLKKAPAVFSYALWAVVWFRLSCPFSFESLLSLISINTQAIPENIAAAHTPQINSGITILDRAVNNSLPVAAPYSSINPLQIWIPLAAFVWVLCITFLLLYSLYTTLKLKSKLKNAKLLHDNVYQMDGIKTPFVFGAIKPKIYFPSGIDEKEQPYLLKHEQTHIKRFDPIIKPIAFLVLCVHWFNPLVWLAFFLLGEDMERSCDESVLREMGNEIKKKYSTALLSLASGRKIIGGSPLAFGESDTKGRIKNVLHYKKPSFWIVAAAIALVIAVSIGLLANPRPDVPSIKWAKSLTAADVDSIELITTPSNEQTCYKKYEPAEFPEIIRLVNQSQGRLLENPEPLEGGAQSFYITTKDGVIHTFRNYGYLVIDGDVFKAEISWLRKWTFSGDSPVPGDFWGRVPSSNTKPAFKSILFSEETDVTKLGASAFGMYMNSLMNTTVPVNERIASYQLNDISLLAGDLNEFCVSINYDFTTDNDAYVNPAIGAKGRGTWPDNYMEIRVKNTGEDSYEIVSIGTGGGGQGLEPAGGNALPGNSAQPPQGTTIAKEQRTSIVFPAYQGGETEYNAEIYEIDPFTLYIDLPDGWSVKMPAAIDQKAALPFTPVYLFDGDTYMGYIGYNTFTLYEEDDVPEGDFYKTVYGAIRLGSLYRWDEYIPISTTNTTETALATVHTKEEVEGQSAAAWPEITVPGILSYDKDMLVYVVIQFEKDAVSEDELKAIAKSITLSPAT